jgi:hypothetical protein
VREIVGEGRPALVTDGGIYEDLSFICDDRTEEIVVVRGDATFRRCRFHAPNN